MVGLLARTGFADARAADSCFAGMGAALPVRLREAAHHPIMRPEQPTPARPGSRIAA